MTDEEIVPAKKARVRRADGRARVTNRTKLSPLIVKAIRDAGSEIYNDDVAKRLRLTRDQVRNSVRTMLKDHPEFGIRETSPYYYVYDETIVGAAHTARPTSGAAANTMMPLENEGQAVAAMQSSSGWAAPTRDVLNVPSLQVERGGITFPQRLKPGDTLTATVAHWATDGNGSDDLYFILNGKMWKAFQI